MFNSQKINNDPLPYIGWSGRRYDEDSRTYASLEDGPVATEPRPEYDNNPNPLLYAFRQGEPNLEKTQQYLRFIDYIELNPEKIHPRYTEDVREHARKVLERLVNVYSD